MVVDNGRRAVEGFVDISDCLRGGVYVLLSHGTVVYVGKSKAMLVRIYSHRALARKRAPAWLKVRGVVFDQVLVQPCHPDRVDDLEQALIRRHSPRYNIQHNPALAVPRAIVRIERRI